MRRPPQVPFDSTLTYPRKGHQRWPLAPILSIRRPTLTNCSPRHPQISCARCSRASLTKSSPTPQADQVCGAEYTTVSKDRVNTRNGSRHRDFDTRVDTVDVAVPKLRTGSFSRLVIATTHPGRTSLNHRDRHLLPQGCVHPPDERPRRHPGHE